MISFSLFDSGFRSVLMEKDILETFEAAKKAADKAAEAGDGSSEVDRCVDALRRLRRIPVTMQQLVETQVLPSLFLDRMRCA